MSEPVNTLTVNDLHVLKNEGYFGPVTPVSFYLPGTSAATNGNYDVVFFIADRDYELIQAVERHGTAGTDASSVQILVTKLPDGVAIGSGTNITPNPSFNLKATANTLQKVYPVSGASGGIPYATIPRNYGLAMARSGDVTSVANVCVTLYLKAI